MVDETWAVEAEHLGKRFGAIAAVDDVCLRVPPGQVYGFIGPNGAGKTTTLRMILGLVAPTSGSTRLFGHDVAKDFRRAIRTVGALVEGPAFYPFLSARKNLRLFAGLSGGVPGARIDALLERVGLAERAEEKVRGYSQGMRQRLGIALALVEEPRLLVLDEPTNGLDPQGAREIRDLIRRVRDEEHTTVLLSSHLLAEMERICDRLAVIDRGRIVSEGTLAEMIGEEAAVAELGVGAAEGERAAAFLRERAGIDALEVRRGFLEFPIDGHALDELNRALVQEGFAVSHLAARRRRLETAFVELTGESSVVAR